jgi:hypothetical protein
MQVNAGSEFHDVDFGIGGAGNSTLVSYGVVPIIPASIFKTEEEMFP